MTIWIHSSCQSRIFLPFSPLLLLETVGNLLKHCPIGPSNSSIPSWKVDMVKMPWNFRHWSVSDIDHRQTGACCACSMCGTFLFALLLVIVLWPQISGKESSIHATSNSRSPFPYLCTKKMSRTCCACSRSGSLFLPYPIQPHPLRPLITVRLKMTSLETFQSNMITNTTKRYVDCSAVSWFLICR